MTSQVRSLDLFTGMSPRLDTMLQAMRALLRRGEDERQGCHGGVCCVCVCSRLRAFRRTWLWHWYPSLPTQPCTPPRGLCRRWRGPPQKHACWKNSSSTYGILPRSRMGRIRKHSVWIVQRAMPSRLLRSRMGHTRKHCFLL